MKLQINREVLRDAILSCAPFMDSRTPVHAQYWIEGTTDSIRVCTTNGVAFARYSIPIAAQEPFSVGVDGELTTRIVKQMTGAQVKLEIQDTKVLFQSERTRLTVPRFAASSLSDAAQDFMFPDEYEFTTGVQVIDAMGNAVVHGAQNDPNNLTRFRDVKTEGGNGMIQVYATDGVKLVHYTEEIASDIEPFEFNFQKEYAALLAAPVALMSSTERVEWHLSQNARFYLKFPFLELAFQKTANKLPDCSRFLALPKAKTITQLDGRSLNKLVSESLSVAVKDKHHRVTFKSSQGVYTVSSNSVRGDVVSTLEGAVGDDIEVSFDGKYFLDIIKAMPETFSLSITADNKLALFEHVVSGKSKYYAVLALLKDI